MGKSSNMPKMFDQDAKDRVVGVVEDRILAGSISTQEACKIVAPKVVVSWHTARQWRQAARGEGRVVDPELVAGQVLVVG